MSDYNPVADGDLFTYTASAAITGGQLVIPTGDGTVGPAGSAAVNVVGVAAHDAASGQPVTVIEPDYVHESTVSASGAVTAGEQLQAGAAGTVEALGATPALGQYVGTCLVGAAAGGTARWKGQ